MTITFTELESTHETADGVHRRRLRSYGFASAGTSGVHRRRIHSYGVPIAGAGDFDPEIPATGVHDRTLRSSGTAFSGAFAEGEHRRSLGSTGIAGAANEAGGTHTRRLTSWGRIDDENAGYGLLVAQPFVVSSYGDQWFVNVFEALRIGGTLDLLPMQRVREVVAFSRLLRSQFEGRGTIADGVAFGDDPVWTVLQVVEDLALFGDDTAPQYLAIARALERIVLSGVARNVGEAHALVVDALVLRALTDAYHHGVAADTLLTGTSIETLYRLVERLLDQVLLAGSADGIYSLTVLVSDQVVLAEGLSHEAELAVVIRDAVGFAMSLSIDSGEYIAWVVNTQSKGLSRYTQYPFNSFGKIGGRYVGCAADGLHWLEGDTDNGEDIHAVIRTSMDALGVRRAKRVPEAFIGYSSSGTLILKVILTGEKSGQREAAYYRLPTRPAESKRENRAKFGRGLKAVDFAFQIENVDGSSFELDSIEFRPINLDRRTRG